MLKLINIHAPTLLVLGVGAAMLGGATVAARSFGLFDCPRAEDRREETGSSYRLSVAGLSGSADSTSDGSDEADDGSARRWGGDGGRDEPGPSREGDASLAARGGWSAVPERERARARTLGAVLSELSRRQRLSRGRIGRQLDPPPEEPEREWADLRTYLVDFDESPEAVRSVERILGEPSNIVASEGSIRLLSWDLRERAPRGSYLYVLEQGSRNRIAQIHRYFCAERRLDVLAEVCEPIASVFAHEGRPIAVIYHAEELPQTIEATDLDPAAFSSEDRYVEANELLLQLQRYFDELS